MSRSFLLIILTLSIPIGCDQPQQGSTAASSSSGNAPPPPPTSLQAPPPPPPGAASEQVASPSAADDQGYDPDKYEREVAEVGVGKKGRNYGGGIISEPIRQRFRIEQRIVFLNIQHSLNQYKALHDRLPRTHEEFMKEIVEEGGLTLPELPQGERYVFDPEKGELMVERPRRQ